MRSDFFFIIIIIHAELKPSESTKYIIVDLMETRSERNCVLYLKKKHCWWYIMSTTHLFFIFLPSTSSISFLHDPLIHFLQRWKSSSCADTALIYLKIHFPRRFYFWTNRHLSFFILFHLFIFLSLSKIVKKKNMRGTSGFTKRRRRRRRTQNTHGLKPFLYL